jgi:hypothetical protein
VRSLEGHGHWVNTMALSTDFVLRTGAHDVKRLTFDTPEKGSSSRLCPFSSSSSASCVRVILSAEVRSSEGVRSGAVRERSCGSTGATCVGLGRFHAVSVGAGGGQEAVGAVDWTPAVGVPSVLLAGRSVFGVGVGGQVDQAVGRSDRSVREIELDVWAVLH